MKNKLPHIRLEEKQNNYIEKINEKTKFLGHPV